MFYSWLLHTEPMTSEFKEESLLKMHENREATSGFLYVSKEDINNNIQIYLQTL